MTVAQRLSPLLLGPLLALALLLPGLSPARAQVLEPGLERGMGAILLILGEVIRSQSAQDSSEASARRELEDEIYRIERERAYVVEDFEQERWEETRRFEEERDEIKQSSWWRGERRRDLRDLRRDHEERMRRLDRLERRRLAELDRELVEAERRYEDRVASADADLDGQRLGDIVRVLDVSLPR